MKKLFLVFMLLLAATGSTLDLGYYDPYESNGLEIIGFLALIKGRLCLCQIEDRNKMNCTEVEIEYIKNQSE